MYPKEFRLRAGSELGNEAINMCNIKCNKARFDEEKFIIKLKSSSECIEKNRDRRFLKRGKVTKNEFEGEHFERYYCYWFPELFGIDEDYIPSSDEEGAFDELYNNEELEERANALNLDELDELRVGSKMNMSYDELRKVWKKQQVPMYGRRARPKPILERQNKEKFECLCEIDRSFSRHYVPRFGGGSTSSKEDLRTPHFVAFWENFREKAAETSDMNEWSKVIEPKPEEEVPPQEQGLLFRPIPKFPSSCRTEMKNFREQLMASFRPLECREIRRFRMPFSEALYLELQEDRYFDSAHFFKNLIIKDYFASKGPDYVPTLTVNKGRMKHLVNFLKIAEKFSRRKEYHKEAVILLKSGKYFNDHNENWWWLAEEFYKKAVHVSKRSVIDGGKMEAISRYILGMFLLECVRRVQLAQEHLLRARELSLGKDWNAANILDQKQEPVYKECSNYLCQALIASSKELRKNGKPEEALPLIHRSYKLCLESRTFRRDIEMETYFELGLTYQALGMLDWAKIAFKKFIEIAKLENYPRSVCDGYLELAITYRSEGDLVRCHHSLVFYLETAEANKDENLIAFGNRYLGEYHLNNGDSKIAAEFFQRAFDSFYKQCGESLKVPMKWWNTDFRTLPHDVELCRVLVGLALGEMITRPLCSLIIKASGTKNKDEILNLINWKNKKSGLANLSELNLTDAENLYDTDVNESDVVLGQASSSQMAVHSDTSMEENFYKTVRFTVDEVETTI